MKSKLGCALERYRRSGDKDALIKAITSIDATTRQSRLRGMTCIFEAQVETSPPEAPEVSSAAYASDTGQASAVGTNSEATGLPPCRLSQAEQTQLASLLEGDELEIGDAMRRLDWFYRYKIGGQLRHALPRLSSKQLADIWQDTLALLLRRAMQRTICLAQGLDHLVWMSTKECAGKLLRRLDGGITALEDSLQVTATGKILVRKWRVLTWLQQDEVLEVIARALEELPPADKQVTEVCEEAWRGRNSWPTLAEVAEAMSSRQGKAVSLDSVERALNRSRNSVRELLTKCGYDLLVQCDAGLPEALPELSAGRPVAGSQMVEPIDRLVAEAVRPHGLPGPVPDLSASDTHLLKSDRAALDRMGCDLVPRVVAEYRALRAWNSVLWGRAEQARETYLRPETAVGHVPEVEHSLEELVSRCAAIIARKRLDWARNCRFSSLLGEGGQGVVYLVECPGSDGFHNLFALKIFTPDSYDCPRNYFVDMRRIAHIASVVALIHNDNLLEVHRLEQQDEIRMMLMEWIDGYDLRRLMVPRMLEQLRARNSDRRFSDVTRVVVTWGPTQPRLRPGMAVAIVRHCLDALEEMHRHGLVHGDIKLSNIMLRRNGHVKLIDIGSAFAWQESPQPCHCTYRYAAPEVLEGEPYTPRCDLASLGYVLIELLSGRSLFADLKPGPELVRAKQELPDKLVELLPERARRSGKLVDFCKRLVHPDPCGRFIGAREAELDTHCGALAFLDTLVQGNLSTAYDHEIRLWLDALN